MIVVTGATGNVGRPLVQALTAAGEDVTAISRRISARDVPAGVRHQQIDMIEPASLRPAVDGAEALFLLTAGEFEGAGGDLAQVLDVVRSADVRRVVLLSSQGVSTGHHPPFEEDIITESGVEWTMLRPGNFASNAFQWAEMVRTHRVLAAPFGDIALPVIDPVDIAEAAAVVLRDPTHAGTAYDLTGPVAISPRQQAEAIGAAVGEPVRFVEETREEARTRMVQFMPKPIVEATLDILSAPGALGQVSPDVERLLVRPARTFGDWASRNTAAFK